MGLYFYSLLDFLLVFLTAWITGLSMGLLIRAGTGTYSQSFVTFSAALAVASFLFFMLGVSTSGASLYGNANQWSYSARIPSDRPSVSSVFFGMTRDTVVLVLKLVVLTLMVTTSEINPLRCSPVV